MKRIGAGKLSRLAEGIFARPDAGVIKRKMKRLDVQRDISASEALVEMRVFVSAFTAGVFCGEASSADAGTNAQIVQMLSVSDIYDRTGGSLQIQLEAAGLLGSEIDYDIDSVLARMNRRKRIRSAAQRMSLRENVGRRAILPGNF